MIIEKEECIHITEVLRETKDALKRKDPVKLKELSDKTIHSACDYQDSASISIAVIIYSLSKLIERSDYSKIRNWDQFISKFNSVLDLAIKSLNEEKHKIYEDYIEKARKLLTSQSISLKPYIQEVIKKASINKGSKIYEHGLSLEQTSKLLGISQWELSEYIGSRSAFETKQNQTINVKERAEMALEFFS